MYKLFFKLYNIFFYCLIFFRNIFVKIIFSAPIFLRRTLRRICVRGICAQMCAGEFARILCAEFVRRICAPNLCARVVRGEFARSVRRENVRRTFARSVRREIFSCRRCARGFFSVGDVRGDVFGDGRGNSGPKMGAGGPGGAKRAKKGQKCPKWPKMAQNGQKGGGARKWPKMAHFVPEWYTSGSGATAFDSTGWQKSPEYALIRIAAGPLFPPGTKVATLGKSATFWGGQNRRLLPLWQIGDFCPGGKKGPGGYSN